MDALRKLEVTLYNKQWFTLIGIEACLKNQDGFPLKRFWTKYRVVWKSTNMLRGQ